MNLNIFWCDAFATRNSIHWRASAAAAAAHPLVAPTFLQTRYHKRIVPNELYSVTNTGSDNASGNDRTNTDDDLKNNNQQQQQHDQQDQNDQHNITYIRYRCRVAYNGATYNGFQLQPNARTIQGELEAVFSRRCNQPVRVVGAGRTDAGVHARGQAIHFDLKHPISRDNEKSNPNDADDNEDLNVDLMTGYNQQELQQIETSINRMLHPTLRIWNLCKAPKPCIEYVNGQKGLYRWNVMRKSHGKLYSYRFSTSSCMDPIERHTRWQLDLSAKKRQEVNDGKRRSVLDIDHLQKLLNYYEGTHDFGCFAGAVEQQQKKNAARKKQKQQQQNTNDSNNEQDGTVDLLLLPPQNDDDEDDNEDMDDISTIRTVFSVTLLDEGNENYRIDITLEGALYKMVRNMVGTALDVCLGRNNLTEEQFLSMLSSSIDKGEVDGDDDDSDQGMKKKKKAARQNNPSKPAPPQGLTLEWVYYDYEDAKIF